MTWTRYQLEVQIADDLARGDLTSQITDAVNTAIRSYRFERLGFNEKYRATATLSSSANVIALSDITPRFRKIDRIRMKRNANDYFEMGKKDYEWLMDLQDIEVATLPTEYCLYSNRIYFDCKADQDYEILIDGIYEVTDNASLSYSVSDTSAWFNDAKELIRHRAKRELYAHVIKDFELAASSASAEQEALRILKGESNEERATGRIHPTWF